MAAVNQEQDEISDINIVPLVDIILVVLIIFMVASPASEQSKIKVDIPQASSGEVSQGSEPFQVTVNEEGYLFVGGEPVSEAELRTRGDLEFKKNSQVEALLTADKGLDYGSVVKVIDLIKSSGIQKIAISTTSGLEE
ncbi:MAG: biopolymer transporter ExbD [Bacteriovoracaceae bacterium]|nr:biopolymer transporter ExbD [Bacteriovoracaceae bacterium]